MKLGFWIIVAALSGFFLGLKSAEKPLRRNAEGERAVVALQREHEEEASARNVPVKWVPFSVEEAPAFIERLKALGCPESELRAIVLGEVNNALAQWHESESRLRASFSPSETRKLLSATRNRRNAALGQIFGANGFVESARWNLFYSDEPGEFSFLSTEAQAAIQKARDLKQERREAVMQRAAAFETSEDRDELQRIEEDYLGLVKSILPPEAVKRADLAAFAATQLGRDLDTLLSPSADEWTAFAAYASGELTRPDLEDRLNRERVSEFMKLHDPMYREALALTKRFSLSSGTAMDLIRLRTSWLTDQYNAVRSRSGNSIGNSGTLQTRLTQLLGAEAAKAYVKDGKYSDWTR